MAEWMRAPAVAGALVLSLAACSDLGAEETPYEWRLPEGFPRPLVPADNPMTEEKVQLGRMLFYDRRLSSNEAVSCATCHQQEAAFGDGRGVSRGVDGKPHPRRSPSLANAAYLTRYNWADPSLKTLEQQLEGPLFGVGAPVREMGLDTEEAQRAALDRLRADPRYQEAFAAAFPEVGSWDFQEIIRALASFVRSIVSGDAPVDRFLRGDEEALTVEERFGMVIFDTDWKGSTCHHCHNGMIFSNNVRHERSPFEEIAYINVGLYNLDPLGSYPEGNQGLYEITGRDRDRGKFRTPGLRNVALSPSFMHDGSVATLEEVVEIYQAGGRHIEAGPFAGDGRLNPNLDAGLGPMRWDDHEKQAVVAFLRALTDPELLGNPAYANPFPGDPFFGE